MGMLMLDAVAASSASAQCVKTYEKNVGNMNKGCTMMERPGQWIEIKAQRKEVKDGVYCAETTIAKEGNYPSLSECEKGENPNVVKGNFIRILLPLNNCTGEEVEQVEDAVAQSSSRSMSDWRVLEVIPL